MALCAFSSVSSGNDVCFGVWIKFEFDNHYFRAFSLKESGDSIICTKKINAIAAVKFLTKALRSWLSINYTFKAHLVSYL